MKIFRATFAKYRTIRPQALLLATITTCLLAVPHLSRPLSEGPTAFAREPDLQGSPPETSRGDNLTKGQQDIIEKNVRIRKLQEGIIDQKIKILGTKRKERTILGEVEKIEKELRIQKNMLATLKSETDKQELLLTEKQEYLHQVLTEKRKHQAHVKKRLAAYYRMGSVGLMNVLFSSETLPELLDFQEYFGLMLQHDHAIIQKYLAEIKESNRAREEHAREKLRLMKLTEEVSENEKQLHRIRKEKNLLLQQVNTEQHLYEQAVQEIEEAAADLAATLQKLEIKAAPQQGRQGPPGKTASAPKQQEATKAVISEGFPAMKGKLEPPVAGTLISRFGQKIEGKFGSTSTAEGIDIMVKSGQKIKAVYGGRIIHSGYLRGYGNLMIIDHGHQYFSLISRAADFYKEEGSKVTTGEVIGITGEGDPLYGEGLHFEIRKGSIPEDPLLWLKKNSLSSETPSGDVN